MTLAEQSRRERKKEETRRRIFEAAVDLFRTKGFEETTVDEITEKADVGRGTFFNYFPKKESVLAYLSEERLQAAEEGVAELLASSAPTREKLIDLYLHAASIYEHDVELSRYVFHESMKRAFMPTAEVEMGWHRLLQALLAQGRERGELRDDVDETRAEALLSSVYIATLFHWLFCPDVCTARGTDLRTELSARLGILLDGLTPRAKGARP